VALVTTIASNARLKKQLSDRLSDLLKIGLDIEFVGGSRVKVFANQEKRTDGQRLFVNEGTGANQLPFILVPIALTPAGETILLSEPEVHLHPERQCELTRMLLKVAKKESIQFFIETHSEHVLHVILNAIARHEWLPSEVAIYYFENVNGTAKTTRLEVDEQGGVKGGLPGFFDQSLDELTEYLESLKKPTA
jgi:predicted ATPase